MKVPEKYRIITGELGSDASYGNNGAFLIPLPKDDDDDDDYIFRKAFVIASDQEGWEHVSVHVRFDLFPITPSWNDMCKIKNLFWDETETVMQFHPKKSEYVNRHPNVLHLWKPVGIEVQLPPTEMV